MRTPRRVLEHSPLDSPTRGKERCVDICWEDVELHALAIAQELNGGGAIRRAPLRVYMSDLMVSLCSAWSKFNAFGRWCAGNLPAVLGPVARANGRRGRRRGEDVVTLKELEFAVAWFLSEQGLIIEGAPAEVAMTPPPRRPASASHRRSPPSALLTAESMTEVQRLARGIHAACATDGDAILLPIAVLREQWLAGTRWDEFGAWFCRRACVVDWVAQVDAADAPHTKLPLSRAELKNAVAGCVEPAICAAPMRRVPRCVTRFHLLTRPPLAAPTLLPPGSSRATTPRWCRPHSPH